MGQNGLFEHSERSMDSDQFGSRHEWGLDGLSEKEANMSKEVIHPSVEPEEVVEVVKDLRTDLQLRVPEETGDAKKEECIVRLVDKKTLTEEGVVDFINEYRDI
ncbi:hypothetical protein C1646_817628 [Rhizophagus diaphanus]|nr:hypothetical protein C1646_817628 [Rhizophagus diaphanus] [Rhizophagus sp. MUCL 43196]